MPHPWNLILPHIFNSLSMTSLGIYTYITEAPPPAAIVQIQPVLLRTVSFSDAPPLASSSDTYIMSPLMTLLGTYANITEAPPPATKCPDTTTLVEYCYTVVLVSVMPHSESLLMTLLGTYAYFTEDLPLHIRPVLLSTVSFSDAPLLASSSATYIKQDW